MNINEEGTPLTIDSAGNVVPRPTKGHSRWSSPRRYACAHLDCPNAAKILSSALEAHNCCDEHEEGVNL